MSGPQMEDPLANHFEAAALELAAAGKALTDAADFVRAQGPPPSSVGIQRAADDPHVLLRFGRFRARLHAAEGLLARARRLASGDAALVSLIEARAFTSDLVTDIAASFRLGTAYGSSSEWSYHHVGNYHLTGATPVAST
jgi:alkylation response protein AidB-like acyl-CoA dehydrogenase